MKVRASKSTSVLADNLSKWMIAKYIRFHGNSSKNPGNIFSERAKELLDLSGRNGSLRVLEKKKVPLAVLGIVPASVPRIKNQKGIFLHYDHKKRAFVKAWLTKKISELAKTSPRYTQISLSPEEDRFLGRTLMQSGFSMRYEILMGDTKVALANLIREKRPPKDLDHLGLQIKPIDSKASLRQAMAIQKKVALQFRKHVFFAHTDAQLKKDYKEYKHMIDQKSGLILGVYRKEKILGLMMAGIYGDANQAEKTGGFSFFLDKSIQGQGVTKTGYRILLQYLVDSKIKKFYGGTSQLAIQGLGKIMKRKVQSIIYVKAGFK